MKPWTSPSLVDKGRKTHALLCLATGWRPASDFHKTLASVAFEYGQGPGWPTTMTLTALQVKEGGDKTTPKIPRLLEDQDLCPVLTTYRYLNDTKEIRSAESLFLFISATHPHDNITADRLRNWLKLTMKEAGIPDFHTPHSIRANTTTTALDAGMSLEEILDAGNWTNQTTFERFYNLSGKSRSSRGYVLRRTRRNIRRNIS
jgi:hypothetical protein